MRELNLKHLHYFWVVANERSITAASERLFVTPQTISAQLRELEERLRCLLFERRGRALILTPAGETALRYSNAIFDLTKELVAALSEADTGQQQLRVGIVDVVPKLISSLLLLPVLQGSATPRLHCREGALSDLLADLARHQVDAVISDHAAPPDPNLRLYSHELGSTGISFLAAPHHISDPALPFPQCLNGLPVLLPGRRTALRMSLENWLREQDVTLRVAAECDDSALIKALGQTGVGVFTCPTAIEAEVCRQYAVKVLGRTTRIREAFYLITTTAHLERQPFATLVERARADIFAPADSLT